MGKQIRFFVTKDDMDNLLQFAEKNGFGALPEIIETDSVPEFQLPTEFRQAEERIADFFFLMSKEFAVVEAFYDELPSNHKLAKMLESTSPVIQIKPLKVDSMIPKEGRIYARPDRTDPRYDLHIKSYNLLGRFIKKWPKSTDGVFYIGPNAAELSNSGLLQIEYGGKTIDIE